MALTYKTAPADKKHEIEFGPKITVGKGHGKTGTALLTYAHYSRLESVVVAAKSGNRLLLRLALENLDRLWARDE